MNNEDFELERFLEAQEEMYPIALQELKQGYKQSHWMWYIFPQMKGLGHSSRANFYGISGLEEAEAYLNNPVLNRRLREISKVLLDLPTDDPEEVFGLIDSMKLQSSMTLFDLVCPEDIFDQVLEKYFKGQRDPETLNLAE